MPRFLSLAPVRGITRALHSGSNDADATNVFVPLRRATHSHVIPRTPLEEWHSLEFRVLAPPSNEGETHPTP